MNIICTKCSSLKKNEYSVEILKSFNTFHTLSVYENKNIYLHLQYCLMFLDKNNVTDKSIKILCVYFNSSSFYSINFIPIIRHYTQNLVYY